MMLATTLRPSRVRFAGFAALDRLVLPIDVLGLVVVVTDEHPAERAVSRIDRIGITHEANRTE